MTDKTKTFELISGKLFRTELNEYPPFKVNKTMVGNGDDFTITKAKRFLNKAYPGEAYILTDVIERKKEL